MLDVYDLRVSYGNLRVLHGVSLSVGEGEIVALLGANGAGKSTALLTIAGLITAEAGTIRINEHDVSARSDDVVRNGVRLVPEGRHVFPTMTVLENLRVGARTAKLRKNEFEQAAARVYGYFPRLADRRVQLAGTLSGGEQQMLAIGRALISRPRLVMIDEMSLGLAPKMVGDLFAVVKQLNEDEGVSFLLVEQFATAVLKLADRAYVLEKGRVTFGGTAAEMRGRAEELRDAYLGAALPGRA